MPRERTYLRYQLYRSKARQEANSTLTRHDEDLEPAGKKNIFSKVRFEAITADALEAYGLWAAESHFTWDEVVVWKDKEPMSFDLSIWFDLELCGLCFANPNQSRLRLKIVRLEGKPDSTHPLKTRIAALALIAVSEYARTIGSKTIEIQEPVKGAIALYQKLGFKFDTEGRLVMALESD
ncbi:MAG: hypothetical protein ACRESJ_02720 [Pseudomonas sp.]|uniref:hypothetical protein n=1 Tax=Pseudomonas sp. TaxID=306 RepID=UPI003D6DAC47